MNLNRLVTALATKVYRRYFPYLLAGISLLEYIVKYRKYRAVESVKRGFADHRDKQVQVSNQTLDRLVRAYRRAKVDQMNVDKPYRVGRLWQEIIDTRFKSLTGALASMRLDRARTVLENFNREDCGDDTCGGGQYYQRMKSIPFYKYQFINAWHRRHKTCADAIGYSPEFDIPFVGNPVGMMRDERVVPLCNLEYRCYAEDIKSLLRGIQRPTVCEIGGGVGGQAYETIQSNPPLTYILLDIPEVLLISSYCLMASLPHHKFLLYGEDVPATDDWDIVLIPNFVMPQLDDRSVDLFFNSCSLSEMDYATADEYTRQIERICKTYLLHVNHNARLVWYDRDDKITNMIADEVVPSGFNQVYREPRLFSLLEDKFVIQLFYKAHYYKYLYRRRF
tara:strand:+ start:2202 stop:3380 length:1179 start_codon:yes stop_codon:yes gene_type:complete